MKPPSRSSFLPRFQAFARTVVLVASSVFVCLCTGELKTARAQTATAATAAATATIRDNKQADDGMPVRPARIEPRYMFHYGVGASADSVVGAGQMCPDSDQCILGSGAGVQVRFGISIDHKIYGGLTYSVAKMDSAKVYRLATLQQIRGEFRRIFLSENRLRPLLIASAGILGYGNEWSFATFGPSASVGAGAEIDLTHTLTAMASLSYRLGYLGGFDATAETKRGGSVVQFLCLEIAIDGHAALDRD
jgi:hypothetical protein